MSLKQSPMRESFSANVANPVAHGAVNILLMRLQLRHGRVRYAAGVTRMRFPFLVQMPIHVRFQEVLFHICIPAHIALEWSLRNGRVDEPSMALQSITVRKRFIAKLTLEVVRVQMFQAVLVKPEPFAELPFATNY